MAKNMNNGRLSRRKSAVSPIVATLLLILIAIAAGVTLYAYISGFIGNASLSSGTTQSTIAVDSACVSKTTSTGCNGVGYFIVIRNEGANTIASGGIVSIYFMDVSATVTITATFTLTSSISPGYSADLSGSPTFTGFTHGDTISVKVVLPDGGAALYTTIAL
jgi:archaeal type IV pilus assembly protein PilA